MAPNRRSSTRAQAQAIADDDGAASDTSPAPPTPARLRGRASGNAEPTSTQAASATTPKKRGRPPKAKAIEDDAEERSPSAEKTPRKKTRKSLSKILDEREELAKASQPSASVSTKPRGGPKKSNRVRSKPSQSRSRSPSASKSPMKDAVVIDLSTTSDEDQQDGTVDAETTAKSDASDWEEIEAEDDDIFIDKPKVKEDSMDVDEKAASKPRKATLPPPRMRMSTGGKIPRKNPVTEKPEVLVPSSDASEDEEESQHNGKQRNKSNGTAKDDDLDDYYESEEEDHTPEFNNDDSDSDDYKDPTPATPKKINKGYKLRKDEDFDTIPDLPPTPSPKKGQVKATSAPHAKTTSKAKFTMSEPQPIVRDADQEARNTDAFEASPHSYVLKSGVNSQIPSKCAYTGYRDKIPGAILYAGVTPLPLKEVKALYHPESSVVPMQLSSIWKEMTEGEQNFVVKILTSTGYRHAINPSRANPYSKDFHFKTMPGGSSDKYKTQMLYVGDTPALGYTLAFATNSSILEPALMAYGDKMKLIHFNPIVHEYERLTAALAILSDEETICVKFYGPGIQGSTRGRKDNWRGFNTQMSSPKPVRTKGTAASGSRFGKLTGATYVSPVKGSNLSRLIKEPTDHIPVYDLRNQKFDLQEDFFNISYKYDEIHGIEAPLIEPLLVTYHITKWSKEDEPEVATVDFNLAWIGVLTKSAIQDPILDVPVMALNG